MQRILVTGASGNLGRKLVQQLAGKGVLIRATSRRQRPDTEDVQWVQADLATGEGLAAAVEGVDLVIHAASDPTKNTYQVDVAGTQRLLDCARDAGVGHFLYISIIGVDRIPLAYYRHKFAAEKIVEQSEIPWSIFRVTQFHSLIDMFFNMLARLPLIILPAGVRLQTIDAGEVATHIVARIRQPGGFSGGRWPDLAGPESMVGEQMMREWLAVRGERRRVIPLWLPGRTLVEFRAGATTAPDDPHGTITWSDWLQKRYQAQQPVVIQ